MKGHISTESRMPALLWCSATPALHKSCSPLKPRWRATIFSSEWFSLFSWQIYGRAVLIFACVLFASQSVAKCLERNAHCVFFSSSWKTLWKFVFSLAGAVEVENHLFCSLRLMQNGDSLASLCECGSLRAKAHYSTNLFTDNIKKHNKTHISTNTQEWKQEAECVYSESVFPHFATLLFFMKGDHIIHGTFFSFSPGITPPLFLPHF